MWVNLGLFTLVWESVAVLAMIPLRLLAPEATAGDLATLGALMAPVAVYVTRLIDHHCLGQARVVDEPPAVHSAPAPEAARAEAAEDADLGARGAHPA